MVADEGRVKASMHHDSQSNECDGSGKGSETACFLGAQSDPRGFLSGGSSGIGPDRRLLRECGREGESSTEGAVGGKGEWEVKEAHSGGGTLNCTSLGAPQNEEKKTTHNRRLRGEGEIGWGSGESSERDRFRLRKSREASLSLHSESVELVSEGAADGLRDGGGGREMMSRVTGGGGA